MGPLKIKAIVSKDHRLQIELPAEVPEGPVELEVTVTGPSGSGSNGRYDWAAGLERLRLFRNSLEGLDLRLSDEVIRSRREEG